jgi:hypothetical protein
VERAGERSNAQDYPQDHDYLLVTLQQKDIKSEWHEIVRPMNTQKCVTTVVQNDREQWISIRKCSEPEDKVIRIYDTLKYKYAPFIRKKSVVPNLQTQKQIQCKLKSYGRIATIWVKA